MEINFFLFLALLSVSFGAVPLALTLLLRQSRRLKLVCLWINFSCYLLTLLVLTTANVKISLPIIKIFYQFDGRWFWGRLLLFGKSHLNIIINLTMFLPVGIFVFGIKQKNKFLSTVLISLTFSVIIESLQWVLPVSRVPEVLDILLNTASGLISACACQAFQLIFSKRK